jgi:hypothetical protein
MTGPRSFLTTGGFALCVTSLGPSHTMSYPRWACEREGNGVCSLRLVLDWEQILEAEDGVLPALETLCRALGVGTHWDEGDRTLYIDSPVQGKRPQGLFRGLSRLWATPPLKEMPVAATPGPLSVMTTDVAPPDQAPERGPDPEPTPEPDPEPAPEPMFNPEPEIVQSGTVLVVEPEPVLVLDPVPAHTVDLALINSVSTRRFIPRTMPPRTKPPAPQAPSPNPPEPERAAAAAPVPNNYSRSSPLVVFGRTGITVTAKTTLR